MRRAGRSLIVAIVLAVAFLAAIPAHALVEVEAEARWHVNYASYFIDIGKYLEALEEYDTAFELSSLAKTRAEALLGKAMVLATFLDAPDKALEIFRQVGQNFPEQAELAAFREAFLYYEMGRNAEAEQAFSAHIQRFPQGRFRYQAEALLHALRGGEAAPGIPALAPGEPVLRVRIGSGQSSVTLAAAKGASLEAENLDSAIRVSIAAVGNSLAVNGRPVGRSVQVRSSRPITIQAGGKPKQLRGEIEVALHDGGLLVLNHVRMEGYLLSVVPAESMASWPEETLKAQAVAARTYALYQKRHRTHLAYDVVDDIGDQMYSGVGREHSRTTAAVRETAGEVLLYGGKPILSQYMANSGGCVASSADIFGVAKPYLVAHQDPASREGRMGFWTRRYAVDKVESALRGRGLDVRGLREIRPLERGQCGRIVKVELVADSGILDLRTRTTLASSRVLGLPDILMGIERSGDGFVFQGGGFGHGVGYSQEGAAVMGRSMDYSRILAHYYPGAQLARQW